MTHQKNSEHLAQVKQALADKYDRLAAGTSSKPRQRRFQSRADRYRRQAQDMRRFGAQRARK